MRKTDLEALDGKRGWDDFQGQWLLFNRLQENKFIE